MKTTSWVTVSCLLTMAACAMPSEPEVAEATANLDANDTLLFAFASDCSGQPVGIIGPQSNCDALSSTDFIRSVKRGTECISTFSNSREVCTKFGGDNVLYSFSDDCSGTAVAAVGPRTNCAAIGSGFIGSVRIGGQCVDVADTNAAEACRRYAGNVVLYGFADDCTGLPELALGSGTDCGRLPSSSFGVSSVRVGADCIDIATMSTRDACTRFVPGSCAGCGEQDRCVSGTCVCTPQCDGRSCGDDGCGGSCGTCGAGETCTGGACVCVPRCNGATCGPDGCGGQCGECGDWETCSQGRCRANPPPPAPACSHGLCATGVPLTETCDPCVTKVCQTSPSCCTLRWDASCKQAAAAQCGIACQ